MQHKTISSECSSSTPELIVPAGDWDCAKAAVENGADGIYFGLRSGLNARARAVNFSPEELPELMTYLRRRGVKGYLTLNTLLFPEELEAAEASIRLAAASGVDAIIVQDLGMLRLAKQVCPSLPLHASTQMTLGSAECIAQVVPLGVSRVVLPRELSLEEIAEIHRQTPIELEVFVHGALCISYSGQCMASLALGGRSGNRGQCAQACRLPYELMVSDLGGKSGPNSFVDEKKYLFSPCDLAAFDLLPEMIAAGVTSLKIEGRLKGAEYVAVVTSFYRRAVDEAAAGRRADFTQEEIAELEAAFSRGFSHGWLDGPNHQTLVAGDSSTKRGVLLGEVLGVHGDRVRIALATAVRRGMGVVFEGGREIGEEQGGRIYEIFSEGRSLDGDVGQGEVELAFRHDSLDFSNISVGQKVWKTDDPQLSKKWRQLTQNEDPRRRVPLDLSIEATAGEKLKISGRTATGAICRLESPEVLKEAEKHPLSEETLRTQLGRLGGSIYELQKLDAKIVGRPMIPFSELGKLRRTMIEQLNASLAQAEPREVFSGSGVKFLRKDLTHTALPPGPSPQGRGEALTSIAPQLHILCRSLEQIAVATACGADGVIADFRDVESYAEAIRIARQAGCTILLASLRIHRPGDVDGFASLEKHKPDGILARNLAAIAYFNEKKTPVVADFSLNAVNEAAVGELLREGASRVTMAYDFRRQSLGKLLDTVPPQSLEVIVHSHVPLFHTVHCLFCGELSTGSDASNCGRPCRKHNVHVRDRMGVEHVLLSDSDCRNTLFHAQPQSLAENVPEMLQGGVRHFRVELLEEEPVEIRRLVEIHRDLLAGKITGWDARQQSRGG
jgi:putative protease